MRFLHIQFTSQFTEGLTYQENQLPSEMVKLGHEVHYWGTCTAIIDSELRQVLPEERVMDNGVILKRFPYVNFLSKTITVKLKYVSHIYQELEMLAPDMIMMHDFQTLSGYAVAKYVEDHSDVVMVADSHTDKFNSANNALSKYILHKHIYGPIARKIQKTSQKVYYLTNETKEFLIDVYRMNEHNFSFLPLGGNIFKEEEYLRYRKMRRNELNISDKTILIMHSGKLARQKKTKELIEAFRKIGYEDMMLIIVGKLMDDTGDVIRKATDKDEGDKRIKYLGWKSGSELLQYLCASDIYAQPGTQSATLQNAACCNCAVIAYPYEGYINGVLGESGCYAENTQELEKVLLQLVSNRDYLNQMKKKVADTALNLLDYRKQARDICSIYYKKHG